MSTEQTWQIDSMSLDETLALAAAVGARLKGGEVIELISDLGGGKTAFVRGLAHGAGSRDRVSSPSFTLSKVYDAPHLTLHHYDFYRLHDAGILSEELAEVLADKASVVVVEWAGIVDSVLPAEHVTIRITTTGEEMRIFNVTCPSKYQYLFKGIGRH